MYNFFQNALWNTAGIRIHQGKTKVWNNAGEQPVACEVLDRMARAADPSVTTSVWRGSDVSQQGMKVYGTPFRPLHSFERILERTWRAPDVAGLQWSPICSLHGCCWNIASLREPITFPGWLSLKLPKTFVGGMTQDCGGVFVFACKSTQTNRRMWSAQGRVQTGPSVQSPSDVDRSTVGTTG